MLQTILTSTLLTTLSIPLTNAIKLYDDYSFPTLQHLSDASPYFIPQVPPKDPDPPPGCRITRAAYLIRNGAIFSDATLESAYIAPFISKLQAHANTTNWCNVNGTGFAFLDSWLRDPPFNSSDDEILDRAGKLEANTLGVQIGWRYPNLRVPGKVWTASSQRAFKTAENLVRGLELPDNQISIVSLPESDAVPQPDRATANTTGTLTPSAQCAAYNATAGADQAAQFIASYTSPILARFKALIPTFPWTSKDILAMQELCGYETAVAASSLFCASTLFSPDEWLAFEYAKDLSWFYGDSGFGVGGQGDVAGAVGLGWVDAMLKVLTAEGKVKKGVRVEDVVLDGGQPASMRLGKRAAAAAAAAKGAQPQAQGQVPGPEQDLYISVSHAPLLASVLTTLGLFNNTSPLSQYTNTINITTTMPLHQINHNRAYRTSNTLSFLGNLAIEKLNCSAAYGFEDAIKANEGEFYRVLVNEAPQVLQGCADGPAESCSRAGLMGLWKGWGQRWGDWEGVCGGGAGAGKMDFFWEGGNGSVVG